VAGSAFYHGDGGENLVRFCFAKTDAELSEACRRLRALPSVLHPDPELAEGEGVLPVSNPLPAE